MKTTLKTPQVFKDFGEFLRYAGGYAHRRGYRWFVKFESGKDVLVDLLYKQRGKYSRPFLHTGMMGLMLFGVTFGPLIIEEGVSAQETTPILTSGVISPVSDYTNELSTTQAKEVAQFRGGEILEHTIEEGETLSSIAARYNLSVNTILWENSLTESTKIKPGDKVRILPVDGIRHKVRKGENIYSIAKTYGLDETQAQGIVNYPFNEFQDDENFTLTVGQWLVIPDGVKPEERYIAQSRATLASRLTPDAGSVSATGSFVWPATGMITQGYRFYHRAIDIANRSAGAILAADSGRVTVAGWPDNSGYGNRVMIDHGNGYVTLYAHMSLVQVQVGQSVQRGDVIGQMGSTGRSTGTHLHFEIRKSGVLEDPQKYLR